MSKAKPRYLLSIDQGTTSSRALLFDDQGNQIAIAQEEITPSYPQNGWVEQDGMALLQSVLNTVRQVLEQYPAGKVPTAVGITNQRETTLIWDRNSGTPIYPAIVWQDRRTAGLCEDMKRAGLEEVITEKTGLLLDPYFSASKIKWILDHVAGARARADRGELAFGTVDSFILWHLTRGRVHATDVTNASRTMLFNIQSLKWDADLLDLFDVPLQLLPVVQDCDHYYGDIDPHLFGLSLPVTGVIGDQQAALIGQGCFEPGEIKCTYGTGGFIMMNIGDTFIQSQNRLLTTVAYQIQRKKAYALEGSFFSAGSAVQWLRDGLKIIQSAEETEHIAQSIDSSNGVYLVSAFTGLGAPYWNPDVRGSLFGLTQASGVAEIVRATLESVGFQTADLLEAMKKDTKIAFDALKVDGGMVGNQWLLQFLADILQVRVIRPHISETTAYGAAVIAGVGSGIFGSVKEIAGNYRYDDQVMPEMNEEESLRQKSKWKKAVESACFYSNK